MYDRFIYTTRRLKMRNNHAPLTMKHRLFLMMLPLLLFCTWPVHAASVLDSFNPNANNAVYATAVQSDGKLLVGGAFTTIGGQGKSHIARLNTDGSVDTTFSADTNGNVYSIVVQTDGQILVGGDFTTILGQARNNVARLNNDGSVEVSFVPAANNIVRAIAVQLNGDIVIGGDFTTINSEARTHIARLSAGNGSLDPNYIPDANGSVYSLAAQRNGKVIVGGAFTIIGGQAREHIARLNDIDGSAETTAFDISANGAVRSIVIQTDGKILVGGDFTTLIDSNGSHPRNRIALLDADGDTDFNFDPNANGIVRSIVLQPDGKVLVGGDFTSIGGMSRERIARLDIEFGSADVSFAPMVNDIVYAISVQADDKILIGGGFTSLIEGMTHNRNFLARLHTDGSVEADFIPNIMANTNSYATVSSVAVQSDNKILVGGSFTQIGGVTRNNLARLNADGSTDTPFVADTNGSIYSIVVQADSKILVAGDFTTIGGYAIRYMARLNTDGSVDTSFYPNPNSVVHTIAVQGDGKIIAGGQFTTIGGMARKNMARLYSTTGEGDTSYTTTANAPVYSLAVQSDGKLVVGGAFTSIGGQTRTYIARLASDGVVDSATLFKNTGANKTVRALAIQADGFILVGGDFTTIDGTTTRNFIARLKADGDIDLTFNPNANGVVRSIAVQADTNILVGGTFTTIDGQARNSMARLSSVGVVEGGFIANADTTVNSIAIQTDGKILTGGLFATITDGASASSARHRIARLDTTGSVDSSFDPDANAISKVAVSAIAVQGDGKFLIGGLFSHIDGTTRNHIARLLPNGLVDTTWNTSVNGEVTSIVIQSNDKILICGNFTSITDNNDTFPRNSLARLNADGTVDGTFNPMIYGHVYAIAEQTAPTGEINGDILIAGDFTTIAMTSDTGTVTNYDRPFMARLINPDYPDDPVHPEATMDTGFNSTVTNNPNEIVRTIATQADGKILIGGDFTRIGTGGASARNNIARLIKTSGASDSTFDPNANGVVRSIVVQPDGNILVGGDFTYIGNQTRNNIARLYSEGTDGAKADDFAPNADASVHSLAIQTDNKILAIGEFTNIGGMSRSHIARLTPVLGTADDFNPPVAPTSTVSSIAVQTDGKIVVGGDFTAIDTQPRNRMARLSADSAALQDLILSTDGKTITWRRTQSSPVVHDVVFYESANNTVWTKINAATTQIADGWQLVIPTAAPLFQRQNRYITASAKTSGGFYNGSTSSIQSVNQYFIDYYTLTVTPKPTNGNKVTSNLLGIDCGGGSLCSHAYQADTSLALTATPSQNGYVAFDGATDYVFTQWGGAGMDCGTGTTNPMPVLMEINRTCTANFAVAYTSVLAKTGNGSGTVGWDTTNIIAGRPGVYVSGKTAGVTAVADPGSVFTGWSGSCNGTASPFELTMNADKTCTATFKIARTLTITTSGAGSGTVGGAGLYAEGTTASAAATANPGSKFTGWSGNCSGTTSPVNVVMNSDKTCNANFEIAWTMTVAKSGTGDGTVGGAGVYVAGTNASVSATANSTSLFTGWTGDCSGTTSPVSVTMNADKTCTANFELKRTLAVLKNGTGTGTVTGAGNYANGTKAYPTAAAAATSIFTGWSGDCTGKASPFELTMDTNKSCTATFDLARTLTITKSGTGTGTVGGAGNYANNTIAQATAVADSGSLFTGWSGNCSGTTSPVDVMMNVNKTCNAKFDIAHVLTITTIGDGSGVVTGAGTYAIGSTAQATATANAGSSFAGWGGDCGTETTTPLDVVMDANKTCTASFRLPTLTVSLVGNGTGTVSSDDSNINCPAGDCSHVYAPGASITLTATPDGDFIFKGWRGTGINCPGTAPCTVTMDSYKDISANFQKEFSWLLFLPTITIKQP